MTECAYSFKDLYMAAFGKTPSEGELLELYALPQSKRNKLVRVWAKKAEWEVSERVGGDGVGYAAFAPVFKKKTRGLLG